MLLHHHTFSLTGKGVSFLVINQGYPPWTSLFCSLYVHPQKERSLPKRTGLAKLLLGPWIHVLVILDVLAGFWGSLWQSLLLFCLWLNCLGRLPTSNFLPFRGSRGARWYKRLQTLMYLQILVHPHLSHLEFWPENTIQVWIIYLFHEHI